MREQKLPLPAFFFTPLHPTLCPQLVAWQKRGSGIKLILAWLPPGANTPAVHLEEGIEPCAGSWRALSEAGNKQDTPVTLVTPGGQPEAPPEDTCG